MSREGGAPPLSFMSPCPLFSERPGQRRGDQGKEGGVEEKEVAAGPGVASLVTSQVPAQQASLSRRSVIPPEQSSEEVRPFAQPAPVPAACNSPSSLLAEDLAREPVARDADDPRS